MSKVAILEGFDMVGKSTYYNKQLKQSYPNLYDCRKDLPDATGNRNNLWMLGYTLIDFLEQADEVVQTPFVISRGVFSSYVYNKIFEQDDLDPRILEWYKQNEYFHNNIAHIYVQHKSRETAEILFSASKSRQVASNEIDRKYDSYESFDAYWKAYCNADSLFLESYDLLKVEPCIVKTLPDFTWEI